MLYVVLAINHHGHLQLMQIWLYGDDSITKDRWTTYCSQMEEKNHQLRAQGATTWAHMLCYQWDLATQTRGKMFGRYYFKS